MMKPLELQGIVRLAVTIFLVVHVFDLVAESAATNVDYPIVRDYNTEPSRRSTARKNRGFKPHIMSTAIGFGKRNGNSFQFPKLNAREALTAVKDYPERFAIGWLGQFSRMYPGVVEKIERSLLAGGEKARPALVVKPYGKNKSDNAYYYDED